MCAIVKAVHIFTVGEIKINLRLAVGCAGTGSVNITFQLSNKIFI